MLHARCNHVYPATLQPCSPVCQVIMNALIIDAALGVVKADIGIKGGMIVGVGKAGNPDVMDGVTPGSAPV